MATLNSRGGSLDSVAPRKTIAEVHEHFADYRLDLAAQAYLRIHLARVLRLVP